MSASRWLGVDLAPLRVSKAYRRIFTYRLIGILAWEATYVTLMFQLKQLTHSFVAVGALGLVELVPTIVFGLYGGVVADHFDRRRVVIATEVGLFVTSVVLLVNARVTHPSAAVIYVVAGLVAVFGGLQGPSIQGILQLAVPHDLQRQASTISMIGSTGASIVGPAAGGFIAVTVGSWVVYAVDCVSFSATLLLLVGLHVAARAPSSEKPDFAALREGARYAGSRPDILGTYAVDLIAMFFAFPIAVLPFMADQFHAPYALAVLYCGLPFGALVASVTSKWTAKVHHYGRAVVTAATCWGLGIALFGAAGNLWIAFVGLAIGGGSDAISGIFRQAMWNESIPPAVRGRMAGIELLSYSVGPTAGQFRAGVSAAVMGLRTSIVVGGLVCSGGCVAVAGSLRSLWSFDHRSDVHVAAVAAERAHDRFDD